MSLPFCLNTTCGAQEFKYPITINSCAKKHYKISVILSTVRLNTRGNPLLKSVARLLFSNTNGTLRNRLKYLVSKYTLAESVTFLHYSSIIK